MYKTKEKVGGVCPVVKKGFVGEVEQLLQGGMHTQPKKKKETSQLVFKVVTFTGRGAFVQIARCAT